MVNAQQAIPTEPELPDETVRTLRIRLIAEELSELCAACGLKLTLDMRRGKSPKIEIIPNEQKPVLKHNDLVEAYDGICDLLVVVLGTAISFGLDASSGFNEVMDSNDTKFIDGHRRADGKWIKGPSYRPANLANLVVQQLKAAHSKSPVKTTEPAAIHPA